MSTFVLVHGTWHGGWRWRKLTPELEELGHVCYTPTLTGAGERFHLASPKTGLSTHIQDVANLLEFEDLHNVILLGHSYSGMVITGVADRTDRVAALVYFDAIVPENGDSVFSIMGGMEDQFRRTADANGLVAPWSPQDFGVTDPSDVAWMKKRLTPFPILTHEEKLSAPKMKARKLPRYFVHCTQFGLGGFGERLRQEGGTVFELEAGHDAMVTEPKKLAVILDKIAGLPSGR